MSTFRIFRLSIRKIPAHKKITKRIAKEYSFTEHVKKHSSDEHHQERIANIYGNESRNRILEMACEDD